MPAITEEVGQQLAKLLQDKYGFSTKTELDRAIADLIKRTDNRLAKGNDFSMSRMIRGLRVIEGRSPINEKTKESDIEYVRALTTGSTPGSYLVPTIQANEFIQFLSTGGILRSSGVRIWDLSGVQKMTVPQGLASPTWVWMAQNSVQTPTDPNLAQVSFDLKERRCLVAIPNQLLQVSVPAFDTLLSELIALGAAENEDAAFFASSDVSGAPKCLLTAAGISSLLVGGSANGGNITYTDIVSCMAKAAAVKAKGPFAWYCSPRTFYTRILGMTDTSSRPIVIPTLSTGLYAPVQFQLLGWPVFVTPFILENEANGSGTNQSHMFFSNPKYIHIAQDGNIEMAISTERFFDANQTAVRATQHLDGAVAPAAGVVALLGIN